jgi:hypothetical protein
MAGVQTWHEWIPRRAPLREEEGRRREAALLMRKPNDDRPRKWRGCHGR